MIDASMMMLAAGNPIEHVSDKPLLGWYVSNYTVMLVLDALITMAILIPAARRIASGKGGTVEDLRAKGMFANMVEAICVYLRNDVFKPVLKEHTDRFAPMLWTFFWFILVCNIVGLIPMLDITAGLFDLIHRTTGVTISHHGFWGTPTQSIYVTSALAAIAFVFVNGTALLKDPVGFIKHLTGGAPWYMWIIMVPIEIIGLFVKPFALALRLFANMTGGHLVIAVLLGFIPAMIESLGTTGGVLAIVPLLGTTAVNLLEILVAFIQAFIFTFLTCLFLSQLVVHADGHGEHGDHGHGHGEHEDKKHATA